MTTPYNCGHHLRVDGDSFCNSGNGCPEDSKGISPIYTVPGHEGQELYFCRWNRFGSTARETAKENKLEVATKTAVIVLA